MKNLYLWALVWIAGAVMSDHGAYAQQAGTKQKDAGCADVEDCAEQAEGRWNIIKKRFEARKRAKDPFGAKMDPGTFNDSVVIPETKAAAPVAAVRKEASLQEAVEKFQVNMVYPKKQMVMVGFDAYRKGETVKIQHDGELFKLQIVSITKEEVVFMNTKNKEKASKRLGVVKAPGSSPLGGSAAPKKSIFGSGNRVIK